MSSRRVLLLVLEEVPEDEIRKAIADRGGDDVNVHVVAPATHISKFQWLTGEEDEARAEAEELADRTAHAVEADAEVEVEVGERDPVLAVQDALALFPADEILVAGPADEKTEAALRDLGLPISRVGPGGAVGGEEASGAEAVARGVAAGKREETPLVVVGSVALIIFAVIALISVVAFLIFWLA
jgi:hypothetical protein